MMPRHRRRCTHRRGNAAIEFALAFRVVLLLFCGLADFGLALWDKSMLANAVAQGGYFAVISGTTGSATAIQTLVQTSSKLSGVSATVSSPSSCYCITGTPLALAAATCRSTCADTTTAGYFVTISATYTYTSIVPGIYSLLLDTSLINPTIAEQTTVRLQ